MERITAKAFEFAEERYGSRPTGAREGCCCGKSVAAIVAGTAQHSYRSRGESAFDLFGYCVSGTLHEQHAGGSVRGGEAIGLIHLRDAE